MLFDLDGVLTTTRVVQRGVEAGRSTSSSPWDARHETSSEPFDYRRDYAGHVDGKARQDGVRYFLVLGGSSCPTG